MTMDDLAQVTAIDDASFASPWPERSYRFELTENPVASLFVADIDSEGDRQIIGYIGLWELVDEGHISTLAVDERYRRHGVASSLIAKGLRFFATRGVSTVSLEVRRSNTAAQSLYKKFGFEEIATRRGYYRDNKEDALIMTLDRIPEQAARVEVQGERAADT
jgi:ribosomal-protein-alanine N-acetyltransferase